MMNRSYRKLIAIAVVVGVLLLILNVLYTIFWKSTLELKSMEHVETILIDDQVVWPGTKEVTLKPGTYTVSLSGPLIANSELQVELSPFETVQIDGPTETLTAEAIASEIRHTDISKGLKITRASLLEGNTWLVFRTFAPEGGRDPSDYIYTFSNGAWKLIEGGTGLSIYTLPNDTIPRSVLELFDTR